MPAAPLKLSYYKSENPPFRIRIFQHNSNLESLTSGTGSIVTTDEIKNLLEQPNRTHSIEKQIGVKAQLEHLKNTVNLNVSQLATILNVKRPTIYEWLEGKTPNHTNQERLEKIYALFAEWKNDRKLRMGGYFYKKWDDKSLYELLTEKVINEHLVKKYIIKIKDILVSNKTLETTRKEKLELAGFKPVSKEQKERALRRLLRRA